METRSTLTVGSVTRRSHMRDPGGRALNIRTSKHMRARAQARMYEAWGSLNKHSVYYDSEDNAQPIPVGRTRCKRTHQVRLPEQDGNNFYQSCALITPGPGEFDAVGRQHSMGQDMRTFRPRFNNRGFGSGDRPCMKEQPETSPGPGAYDLSGSAVYGLKATTFRAISKQHKTPEIENCALVLHNLQFRIARIREAADVNNRMAAGKRRMLQEEGRKHLQAMEAKAQAIREVMDDIRHFEEAQQTLNTRFSKTARLAADKTRAKSHPLSNRTSRFWDPIHDTSTPLITPGPTTYCPSSLLTLGIDSMSKAPAFCREFRPTDADAPVSKSLVAVKLTKQGYPYYADVIDPGPSEYCPPNFPTRKLYDEE